MTWVQQTVLEYVLGTRPTDPRAFFKAQSRASRERWLKTKPAGYSQRVSRVYRKKNPLKANEESRKWNGKNRDSRKNARLQRKYRISLGDWNQMLSRQGAACAICRRIFIRSPHVDHCHKTGRVRGLLCFNCNSGIGYFRDDPKICDAAKEYLNAVSE